MHVLPPASAWMFRNGSVERKAAISNPANGKSRGLWRLRISTGRSATFSRVTLPRYFNGRERVGMSLTGGLDTRMIMAWHKPAPGSLPCYTFGGTYRECRDVIVARQVAALAASRIK